MDTLIYLAGISLSTLASKSNTSLNKCSQNGARRGIIRLMKMIPIDKVTGKPIAKTDS
jgi:hypothetical protein